MTTHARTDVLSETASSDRFEFGRNWKRFIQDHLSQAQIEHSKRHLLDFLGVSDLGGRSFLDIGCGSGLHSLAAHQSGARDIFGFDYDPHSVDATLICRRFAGDPPNWRVVQGSILDEAFVGSLSPADIVYSWGVLHHTGDVWRAVRNAAGRVRDGGVFYLALYSADVQKDPPPAFWLDVKRRYEPGDVARQAPDGPVVASGASPWSRDISRTEAAGDPGARHECRGPPARARHELLHGRPGLARRLADGVRLRS